jgi:acetyltransferase-like isoleucine patch superfamily enzyme
MVKLSFLAEQHIGPRTLLKSYRTYIKCKAGKNGKGVKDFLLNGNIEVRIGKNAVVENKGHFQFGLRGLRPSKVEGLLQLSANSKLVIEGSESIGPGTRLIVLEKGVMQFEGGLINSDSTLVCSKLIKIGNGTVIGCEVEILDNDFHSIDNKDSEISKPIIIGSHVWVGDRATILKGVTVGSGSVIACGAIVTRNVPENTLVAGVPAKVIRKDVHWKDN